MSSDGDQEILVAISALLCLSWSSEQTERGGERLLLISEGIRGRCRDLDALQGKLSRRAQLEADCG